MPCGIVSRLERPGSKSLRTLRAAGVARPFRRFRAFTLVELLIGMSLSAAILAAVLSSYLFMGRNLARLTNQQTLEAEGRRTLAYLGDDVRLASDLTDTVNLSATRVSLLIPKGSGTNTITYYHNNTSAAAPITINGSSISMPANSLTRCVYDGSTVTSQTLLRNITTGSLAFSYYDASGREYTTYVNYLPGIKQIALAFSTQTGTDYTGSRTKVQQLVSSRLVLRNRALLP